jgi:transcriptional regulator with XRE-family HTH domain
MTLRDLAAKSGQSLSTITDIEGGRRMPRIDTLEKTAHALSVSTGWLAYGDGIVPEWLGNAAEQKVS